MKVLTWLPCFAETGINGMASQDIDDMLFWLGEILVKQYHSMHFVLNCLH